MASYTPLSHSEAQSIADAHQLGAVQHIEAIAAGSVNSNYIITCDQGRGFLRIYEEQERDGVAYEWHLLDHLNAQGIAVPQRLAGPGPGEKRVQGKPTALFAILGGDELCMQRLRRDHMHTLGKALAQVHAAAQGIGNARRGRFEAKDLQKRLQGIDLEQHPELSDDVQRLLSLLREDNSLNTGDLPQGVIHGDLFRDNVRWEEGRIIAIIDWESASHGLFIYDIAVVLHAWCFRDHFDAELMQALLAGYEEIRELSAAERHALPQVARMAALRFTITRITDFYLRRTQHTPATYKDYRRFLARMGQVDEIQSLLTKG